MRTYFPSIANTNGLSTDQSTDQLTLAYPNKNPHQGIFGVPICNRDVKEFNKRGAGHIHGQHHGGNTPSLLSDVADNPKLLALALAALDTQIGAEMPLEYHLVDTARQIFRLGKRRDAAATIPRPTGEAMQYIVPRDKDFPPYGFDDTTWPLEKEKKLKELWYPTFLEDAMTVIGNRNVHKHQASCLSGKRGKSGCRFCAPWGHNIDVTRCVELFLEENEAPIEYRCFNCYANGAMSDTADAAKALEMADQNYKRDLYYSVGKPSQRCETGDDNRILAIDTQRPPLPVQKRIKNALDNVNSTEYIADLRRVLLDTITLDAKLAKLLDAPQFKLVRDRLMDLTVQPTNAKNDEEVFFFYPYIRHAYIQYKDSINYIRPAIVILSPTCA